MIYQGKHGSINCFYKRKLIVSRPIHDHTTFQRYYNTSVKMIREGLESGLSLNFIKKEFYDFIKNCRYKEKNIDPKRSDRDIILITFLICCKLQVIDPDGIDEGLLIMPRKK